MSHFGIFKQEGENLMKKTVCIILILLLSLSLFSGAAVKLKRPSRSYSKP